LVPLEFDYLSVIREPNARRKCGIRFLVFQTMRHMDQECSLWRNLLNDLQSLLQAEMSFVRLTSENSEDEYVEPAQ
jgi:hypothetical protein